MSPAAAGVIRSSHQVQYRASASPPGADASATLDALTGGTITTDSKSQVRRKARIDVADPTMWTTNPGGLLSPFGSEVFVEYGIVIPRQGVEWVPLIHGPVQDLSGGRPSTAAIPVSVSDRSQTVADDRLTYTRQTSGTNTYYQDIRTLIAESVPGAQFVIETSNERIAPSIEIDQNRWSDGVEKLADAGALEVYADATGRFVIRDTPTVDDNPVWVVDEGDTGVLIKANWSLTRDRVYNAVLARGQRADGTPPVSALVVDDDANSPTRWGGPFGEKLRYFTSPLLTTVEACEAAGRSILARVKGIAATVELEILTNPALEGGDVVELRLLDGTRQRHIIDSVPVVLSPSSSQRLTTRSIDLPAES